jgi:hypothetical protein
MQKPYAPQCDQEKQKSTCFGILYKIANVQVMNFIPVKVSRLYKNKKTKKSSKSELFLRIKKFQRFFVTKYV